MMMYMNAQTAEQLVRDQHDRVAAMYASTWRRGGVATGFGSLLIRVGEWLRRDVEMPVIPVRATPDLRPGGCDG